MSDEQYLRRCFELAKGGAGAVSPNPMVGCVIVHQSTVIGEGYHARFGEAHAEVNAVADVFQRYGTQAEELLREATVYVNLEPCAHFGKTPPCADLLIRHQVKRVVISNTDPFPQVAGKGIARLQEAGITVQSGLLAAQGAQLNRRFFTRIQQQRPFFILKWAQTANGYFAPLTAQQQWISGSEAKALTHQWRAQEDAILIGKNTALIDNPQLTTRLATGKNPIRILIDRALSVPRTALLFNEGAKVIVLNEVKTAVEGHIHYVQVEDMHFYLPQKIAFQLYLMDIQSVIIEGGENLLSQFITAGLWDEARIFSSPSHWPTGKPAPLINGTSHYQTAIGTDTLTILTRP